MDTAHTQNQSPFFNKLIGELRNKIYEYVAEDIHWHVIRNGPGRFYFVMCITGHDAPDERQLPPMAPATLNRNELVDKVWKVRLVSLWKNHWRCLENYQQNRERATAQTPWHLALALRSCKQM